MTVHADRMRANLDLTHGAIFSQRALTALVESGMSRDDAYRLVQEAAQEAWDTGTPFRELLGARRAGAGPRRGARRERVRRARARGDGAPGGARRVTSPAETTEALREELERTLSGLISPGTEIAYVNFPNIGNLGDAAIYAGARRALARVGAKVALAVEPRAYRPAGH